MLKEGDCPGDSKPKHWTLSGPEATILDKNIGTTTKNGVVLEATSNVKLFLETIWLG